MDSVDGRRNGGWPEYRRLVEHELKQLNKKCDDLLLQQTTMAERFARLETKVAIYGAGWGLVSGAVVTAIVHFMTG